MALDYAEPGQHVLLVEGICPVLLLIQNMLYDKHIQNKLQCKQMDHYGSSMGAGTGSYGQHMALNTQTLGMGPHGMRHVLLQVLHPTVSLADVYSVQNRLYSLQVAGLQGHAVNTYVLQDSTVHGHSHSQGLQSNFSTISPFQDARLFASTGLAGVLNMPYQHLTLFGYSI
jgi:hypothetical protein